jgi:hypothetical protein
MPHPESVAIPDCGFSELVWPWRHCIHNSRQEIVEFGGLRFCNSPTAFAEAHGLCLNELTKLVNKRKLLYRGWVLEETLRAADWYIADGEL